MNNGQQKNYIEWEKKCCELFTAIKLMIYVENMLIRVVFDALTLCHWSKMENKFQLLRIYFTCEITVLILIRLYCGREESTTCSILIFLSLHRKCGVNWISVYFFPATTMLYYLYTKYIRTNIYIYNALFATNEKKTTKIIRHKKIGNNKNNQCRIRILIWRKTFWRNHRNSNDGIAIWNSKQCVYGIWGCLYNVDGNWRENFMSNVDKRLGVKLARI